MGKKYLLEIEENKDGGFAWSNFAPYAEPNLDAIRKEAYDKGCETAKHECEQCRKVRADAEQELAEKAYQRGLNDAWEAARKIILDKEDGGLDTVTYNEIFGYGKGVRTVLKIFTASEAIEKIRQYEQEKEEIQVGDEVECIKADWTAIVTKIKEGYLTLMGNDGAIANGYNEKDFIKTGRHFSEIAEVLRKMKENSDGNL